MSTPLEDRLRAHFAEQAAREQLGEPDPQAIIDRAQAGPRPLPAGRRARPGRTARIAVVAGLAAACLLVVAVVATTDRNRDSVDIGNEPSTTESEPGTSVTPTTTPPAPTPTTTPTLQVPQTSQGVAVVRLGVLGWWDGQGWVDPEDDAPVPLEGGEEYQVTGVGVPDVATVTGPAPELRGCGIGEVYGVALPSFDAALTAHVAVTGVTDIQPRPVTLLDPAGYRNEAVTGLAGLGINDSQPTVTQAVRVDLDGNGSDEVLLTVTRSPGPGTPARPGDYSVLFVRRVVAGSVEVTSYDQSIPDPTIAGPQYVDKVTVGAVADLNGDGRMEVITEHELFEGQSAYAYELDSGGNMTPVLGVSCGV